MVTLVITAYPLNSSIVVINAQKNLAAKSHDSLNATTLIGKNISSVALANLTSSHILPSIKISQKPKMVNLLQISHQRSTSLLAAVGRKINIEDRKPINETNEKALAFLKIRSKEALSVSSTTPHKPKQILIDPLTIPKLKINVPHDFDNNSRIGDPAAQKPPTLHSAWNGLNYRTSCDNGLCFFPPDLSIGAGPNHIVEITNLAIKVWNKAGELVASVPLSAFYNTGSDFIFDSKVAFDNLSRHWFVSLADAGLSPPADGCGGPSGCSVLIAVSVTSDPTAQWWIYSFPWNSTFADQPIIATNNDKLAISVNDFNTAFPSGAAEVYVVDKKATISGAAANYQSTGVLPNDFSVHPIQSLSSSGCLYLISVGHLGTSTLKLYNVCGNPTTGIIFNTLADIPMGVSTTPPQGTQPAGIPIDTGDGRMLTASYYLGKIWDGFNDACAPVGGSTVQACIRVQEIDLSNLTGLMVDTDIAALGADIYYPALSIATNGGMHLIFGISDTKLAPSLVAGGDNWGFGYLAGGSTSNTDCCRPRYGDYFGAAADPNGLSVWVAGEYGNSTLPNTWSSYVGAIS